MKRANIRIKGNVQMAGFRTFIKNIADSLNVKVFAENQEDGSVRLVCEGEEEGITRLITPVKQKTPSFASIEEMNVAYEEYKGEFTSFERRGADVPKEEMEDAMLRYMQSFDNKGEVMIGILSSMNETLKGVKEDTSQIKQDACNMLVKQDMMLEKQDTMLEKQDDTIGAIREVSEKIDRGKEDIVTEVSSLSQPFSFRKRKALAEKKKNSIKLKSFFGKAFFSKERFENKFAKIEYEIAGIKAKVGMV